MSKNNSSIHLSPSEKTALRCILENGPTYAYHLSHTTPKILETEKTANTALNSLSRKGLLEKKGTEGERDRKDYYLTLKGLCAILAFPTTSDEIWTRIESVIEKWGHLLPLLKKLYLFKKHDLEEHFKDSLIKTSRYFIETTEPTSKYFIGNTEPIYFGRFDIDLIERSMHRADAVFMMKWNRVLHEDAELRQKTKWHLELEKRMKEQYLEEFTGRLSQVFPKLEQPNPDWDAIRLIELNLQRAHICDSGLVLVNGKIYYNYQTSNDAPSKP
jgi:DNA-binding MarR family transcriptional regulator